MGIFDKIKEVLEHNQSTQASAETAIPAEEITTAVEETVSEVVAEAAVVAEPVVVAEAAVIAEPVVESAPVVEPVIEAKTYTVESGDNLTWISENFGVSVDAIVQANGIDDPDLIFPGQVLTIPA